MSNIMSVSHVTFDLSGKLAESMEAVAVVSTEDMDLWGEKWNLKVKGGVGYASRRLKVREGRKEVYLHRVVMERMLGRELEEGEVVDHVNGHGLDCTRGNLRVCDKSENGCNYGKKGRSSREGWSSRYKGVYRFGRWRERVYAVGWMVKCRKRGRAVVKGPFKTEEEAALVYNELAREMHGEFAWQNVVDGNREGEVELG